MNHYTLGKCLLQPTPNSSFDQYSCQCYSEHNSGGIAVLKSILPAGIITISPERYCNKPHDNSYFFLLE